MPKAKRQRSCVTVVRTDAEGDAVVSLRPFSDIERQRNMTPIYPPISCTTVPACGHCWFCRQRGPRP